MLRKTFPTREQAISYQDSFIKAEGIAVVVRLGDKFRVYANTKEMMVKTRKFRGEQYTKGDSERFLRQIAWKESAAIDNALSLQQLIEKGSIYNDYESSIDAARIMEGQRELRTARDVFDFMDDTHKYDKIMKQFIQETLEEYDYEGAKETSEC